MPGISRVYNLTVEGERVDHVSALGTLVHNCNCASTEVASLNATCRRTAKYTSEAAKADIKAATRALYDDFLVTVGKIEMIRPLESIEEGVQNYGKYHHLTNTVALYASSNARTVTHELLH